MNIQDWFPLGLTGLISLLSKGLTRVFSSITDSKYQFLSLQPSLKSNSHTVRENWKSYTLDYMHLCWHSMALLLKMLSRFVIAFLPRSKHLLISWLQSPSAVILEPRKIKFVTVSVFSLFYFTLIKSLFSSSLLSAIRVVSSAYLSLLIFLPAILIPACDWYWSNVP